MKKEITLKEAEKLPDMLGKMAAISLKYRGRYACTVGGQKVEYVLKNKNNPDTG